MNKGHATLVVDPYQGFSVVFTDEWGNVVYRSASYCDTIQSALLDGARWFGAPLVIDLKMLKP